MPSPISSFYEEEKFVGWTPLIKLDLPLKLIRQDNLDDAPALVRPMPSYTDTTMGLGEIEVSRGCRGMCAFCGIGWKYRPYRERSRANMFKLMQENRLNSGATTYCPIATEFAYYSEKQGLINDLMSVAHGVDPLSMRVDAFIDDPDFDAQLADRGMNQVALGVEAPSQRLRNRLMKGITEKQILRACEIGLEKGFKRLKFFMISNIDEEWEDFEEFFALLRKVREMEVSYKQRVRTGWDIQIVASWTPWFIEPCTPMQWKKPTSEQRKDWKRVDEILRGELKCKFKLGIKNAEDFLWTMQGMHLGDTRFAESLVAATLSLKRPFYVSFTKKMKSQLTKEFITTGYSWDYVMRERGAEEEFPWDIVSRNVSKKVLRSLYDKIVSGEKDDVVTEVKVPVDRGKRTDYEGEHTERTKNHWWLVGYDVTEQLEVVPNTHIKALVHRAAFQTGFPLSVNSVKFFSDRDVRNWYGGRDFFVYGTPSYRLPETVGDFLRETTLSCGDAIHLGATTPFRYKWRNFASEYEIILGVPVGELQQYLYRYNMATSVLVATPSTRYFSGSFSKKKMDIKEEDVFVSFGEVTEGDIPTVSKMSVRLGHEVGIRYFLQGLLHDVSFIRILKCSVVKTALIYHRVNYKDEVISV